MRKLQIITAVVLAVGLFNISADAQRRRTPAKPKVVTTNNLPAKTTAANTQSGVQKVAIQLKNVNKFIFVLGGVARGIEDLDKDTKANRNAKAENEENKRKVIQTIRNLRAGLATLEVDFRTQPALQKYLLQIQGITDMSAQAEDLALKGRFTDSGKPLLMVVEKLTDTLAAM